MLAVESGEGSAVVLEALQSGNLALAWSMGKTTRLALLDGGLRISAGPFDIVKSESIVSGTPAEDAGPKTFWPPQQAAPIAATDLTLIELPGGAIAVAAIEAASSIKGGGAFLVKIDPKNPDAILAKRVGSAGRHATTLSASQNGGILAVAWHEGRGDASRIRIALLSTADLAILHEHTLESEAALSFPHLMPFDDGFVLAYVRIPQGDAFSKTDVVLVRLDTEGGLREKKVVARSRFLAAEPRLVRGPSGPAVVYRDDEERDDQAEYFLLPLDEKLEVSGPPARISRSDGYRGPRVIAKDGLLLGATIRSFQRNLLVGLNRFDAEGRKKGGEFQVYADDASFVRVDLESYLSQTLLAYLEEAQAHSRLLVSRVECAEPVSP